MAWGHYDGVPLTDTWPPDEGSCTGRDCLSEHDVGRRITKCDVMGGEITVTG